MEATTPVELASSGLVPRVLGWFNDPANAAVSAFLGDALIAVGAVLGVFITAWVATTQLKHERKEKAEDRALEVRKGVMIDGIKAISDAAGALMSLSNLEVHVDAVVANYQRATTLINAACSVASIETAKAGKAYLMAIGPAFTIWAAKRHKLDVLKDKFEVARRVANSQQMSNAKMLETQLSIALSSDADKNERVDLTQRLFESGNRIFAEETSRRDSYWNELESKRREYALSLLDQQGKVMPLGYALAASLRRDMGMPGTKEEFIAAFAISIDEVHGALSHSAGPA